MVHSPGDLVHSPGRLQSCLTAAVGTSTLLEMTLAGAGATSASGKGKKKKKKTHTASLFFAVFAPDCPSALRVLAAAGLPAALASRALIVASVQVPAPQ